MKYSKKPAFARRKGYVRKPRKFQRKSLYGPKTNLVKRVNNLQRLIGNPEKKKNNSALQDVTVGQCNQTLNAYLVTSATPSILQGNTSITRVGNYVKLVSSHIKYQFQGQSNYNAGIRLKIMLIHTVGTPITSAAIPGDMFYDNAFITGGQIIDYNSDRREQTFRTYKVLRTKYLNIPPNNHTGQLPCITGSFGVKYKNHMIKYFADGSTQISAGQLTILVLADNGNINAVASGLAGTATTTPLSGVNCQMDISHWYTDS